MYEYERVAKTNGWIFHDEISKPDFYLTEYNVLALLNNAVLLRKCFFC